MSRNLLFPVLVLSCAVEFLNAKPQAEVSDPAGKTEIRIVVTDGVAECGVWHSGKHLMDISRLGFVADIGDFSKLELESVAKSYLMSPSSSSQGTVTRTIPLTYGPIS